jgi:hypothetical protein
MPAPRADVENRSVRPRAMKQPTYYIPAIVKTAINHCLPQDVQPGISFFDLEFPQLYSVLRWSARGKDRLCRKSLRLRRESPAIPFLANLL